MVCTKVQRCDHACFGNAQNLEDQVEFAQLAPSPTWAGSPGVQFTVAVTLAPLTTGTAVNAQEVITAALGAQCTFISCCWQCEGRGIAKMSEAAARALTQHPLTNIWTTRVVGRQGRNVEHTAGGVD